MAVAIAVAITYFLFEQAVHKSIQLVWEDLLNTETTRLLIFPLTISIGLLFFGLQHKLDKKSEGKESHSLGGEKPEISARKFGITLFVGFFSLLAGASLGPEAILVPACLVAGGLIGKRFAKKETATYSALGLIALMAAFFNSFFAGLAGLLLVKKQSKDIINVRFAVLAVIASATTVLALKPLEHSSYVELPTIHWSVNSTTLLATSLLFALSYGLTYILKLAHDGSRRIYKATSNEWWLHALVASLGLSVLYLAGGSLVQFTGNESILPMIQEAPNLGVTGLILVALIKIIAIAWSKAAGYRGGLIFPIFFVASTLVVITGFYFDEVNFLYGLVASMLGFLAADKNAKVLL